MKEITGATSPIALKATGEDPSLRRTRMVITTGSGIPTTDLGVDSTVVLVIDRVTVDTTMDHLGIDMVAKAMMMDLVTGGVSGTTAMDPLVNDQGTEDLKMDLGIVRVSDQVMVETEDLMMVPGEMIVMETEEADLAVDGMLTIGMQTINNRQPVVNRSRNFVQTEILSECRQSFSKLENVLPNFLYNDIEGKIIEC